jgi:pimeloyl-ACP methyl ester carboxylesterase
VAAKFKIQLVIMSIIQTSRGNIEYRLEGTGDKVALLLYGGHTSAKTRLGEDYFMERRYKVLAVSRPGYGETPLASGQTPNEFADALSEMLGILKIPKVLVVGISAGGRTAIRFAARHANMTDKLILQSSISFAPYPGPLTRLGTYIGFNGITEKYTWKLMHYILKKNPRAFIRMMIANLTTLNPTKIVNAFNEKQLHELTDLFADMRSGGGFVNDIKTVNTDASDVIVPTLIIHSKYDGNVSLVHPHLLAKQIKGSELYLSEAESHLIWFSPHYGEIEAVMDKFLESNPHSF